MHERGKLRYIFCVTFGFGLYVRPFLGECVSGMLRHSRLHAHCAEPMTPEEAVVTRPERQLASGNLDEQSKDALGHFWARRLMAIELLRIATHRRPQQEPAKTPSPTRFSRPPLR